MWTNVFRIGDLHAVSWFQLIPSESESSSLSEKTLKTEAIDVANHIVLSAHIQLQNEGLLSTWTNNFVGPWDPSQGEHNPDEKLKLWLFLPGRHSSIHDSVNAAVSRLRVVASGLWLAPGDSEEVAVALSQALKNSLERALRGLFYVRFGDAFLRCPPSSSCESAFRKGQLALEFVFAATEEAVFVLVVVSAKCVRRLCSDDIENVLMRSSHLAGLPVIVAPHGMLGRLTGCCPSDLVKQVYTSKDTYFGKTATGPPYLSHSAGFLLRGQRYYVEVTLGCPSTFMEKVLEKDSCQSKSEMHSSKCSAFVGDEQRLNGLGDHLPILERTFIYPPEAIVVPMIHQAYSHFSNKRLSLLNYPSRSLWETWPFWNFSHASYFEHCFFVESSRGFGVESYIRGLRKQHNSSSNSITSSISSVNSTSRDSENADAADGVDIDGDADSLANKRSDMSFNDHGHNGSHKLLTKRTRGDVTEVSAQDGRGAQAASNAAAAQSYSLLAWEDDDIAVDIHILLSEFGDFGDFFENGVLNFGEPPGTAESHALVLSSTECEITSSPCAADFPDPILSPVGGTTFEGLSQQAMVPVEDVGAKTMEPCKDITSPGRSQSSVVSPGKFDHLSKAESALTFAPEYAAVEFLGGDRAVSLFLNPYIPRSKKIGTSSASPITNAYECQSSARMASSDDKAENSVKLKQSDLGHASMYTLVHNSVKDTTKENVVGVHQHEATPAVSGMTSVSSSVTSQKNGNMSDAGYFLLSMRTALATDIECALFQAAMCRVRHTLLSLRCKIPLGLGSSVSNLISNEVSIKSDVMSLRFNDVKKESIPVRIAGDTDIEMYDGSSIMPQRVWRPVGGTVGQKLSMHDSGNFSSLVKSVKGETSTSSTQRQPLFDLLSAIPFLVQQAASFVDVVLDTDDSNGPYCWLALQEQSRRGFSCDPSMVHAGCGGLLARCHSLDIAGNSIVDPLAADISASSMISMLESDIKSALRSAFCNVDGPLSVIEWCRSRNNSAETAAVSDGPTFKYAEVREQPNSVTLGSESMSPSQSTSNSLGNRDSVRVDDMHKRPTQDGETELRKGYLRSRPTLAVLPAPAILVGYQDDWLKTSADGLKEWEKAPLEPYASLKPVNYCALCPDVDILSSAAVDFLQQLGTVYEACKLGNHSPLAVGGHAEASAGRYLASGVILIESPEQLKNRSVHLNGMSPLDDYNQAISKYWSVKGFVTCLTKILKDMKFVSCISANQKENNVAACNVVYVICPFPDPSAVLQTLVECSVALGSSVSFPEKERKSLLHTQVAKSLNCIAADESSTSNVIMLSGFSLSKVVLQIVSINTLLRINKPVNELAVLKDLAFTVYNKARRILRGISSNDMLQSFALSGRSQSASTIVSSTLPTLWKDCLVPPMPGSGLTRESEYDNALRPVPWDNAWPSARARGLSDTNKLSEICIQDERRYSFEPIFILAEPGSTDYSVNSELSTTKSSLDESFTSHAQASTSGSTSEANTFPPEGSEFEKIAASLHCSYEWTEDWRWLICIWTDSRGELLDSLVFPFGGISSRQDTKLLQSLFIQVLQHGCQVIATLEGGVIRPRDVIISRAGSFFELEAQEWQKAIYTFGGNEVKKWPVQLRRAIPECISSNTNGPVLHQPDIGLMQERNMPSSPSPSLYNSHPKSSYMKGVMGQSSTKKHLIVGQTSIDNSRGSLQLVQSITLVAVSLDHSLHLIYQADIPSSGSTSQGGHSIPFYLEGFSPVKSIVSTSSAYLFIPSPSFRYLSPTTFQLPACLTSESPPLAHLLQSKGSAIPLATGYVVSNSVTPMRKDIADPPKGDWPSILAVSLIDHYGFGSASIQESSVRAVGGTGLSKSARTVVPDGIGRGFEIEKHSILESVAAELHALSWMTMSPVYIDRRSTLPFHCDLVLRIRRLLHYADKELSRSPDSSE